MLSDRLLRQMIKAMPMPMPMPMPMQVEGAAHHCILVNRTIEALFPVRANRITSKPVPSSGLGIDMVSTGDQMRWIERSQPLARRRSAAIEPSWLHHTTP